MSYSFTVKASTRKEAKDLVGEKLAEVVKGQQVHENDVHAAQDAVGALLDVVNEPEEDYVLRVSVNGSLNWREEGQFIGANLNVTVQTVLAIHYQD